MKMIFSTLALSAMLVAPAAAQDDTWTWRKAIPAGQTVEIKGVQGSIVANAASGSEVEVTARKSARRGDIAAVKIEVQERADGVTICVVYESGRDCDQTGGVNTKDNDTRVDFEVRLPRGVNFEARTVSGSVEASDLSGDVDAATVSGDIRIRTSGLAEARSVSGSIRARMGKTASAEPLSFNSVSGDIVLEMEGDLNADVNLSTVSGSLESDWPVTLSNGNGRQVRGRIGTGGRNLSFRTVSGDVELRRAN